MIYNFERNKKNNEMKRPSLTSDNITPLKGAFDKFPDMKGIFVKSTINKNQKTIKEFFLERIGHPRFEKTSSNSEDKKNKNEINNKKQNNKFLDFKINFGSTIYYDLRDYQTNNNNENLNKIEFNKKLLQKSNNFTLTRSKIPISTFFYDRNKKIKQNLNKTLNNFKKEEKSNKIEPKNENNEKISFLNKDDYFNKHIINQKLKINKNLNNNNNINNNSFTNTKNTLFVNYKKFKPLKIFDFSSNSKQDFSTINSQENINNFNTIVNSTTGNSFYSKDNIIIQKLNKTENNFYKKNTFYDNLNNISLENSKNLKIFEKKFNKKLKILNKKQNNMNKKLFRIINRSQVKRKEKPLDKVLEVILDKKMKKQKKKNDIKDLYIKASDNKEIYKIMNSEKAGILQMGDLITKISDEQALKLSERIIENYNIKEEKLEIGNKLNIPEFIKKKLIKEAEISRKNMINNNKKLKKMRINIINKKDNLFNQFKRVLSPIQKRKIFVLNDEIKDEDLYDKIYF